MVVVVVGGGGDGIEVNSKIIFLISKCKRNMLW